MADYRIVYGIDDERRVVEILNVAHRRDVYRRG
ncbi:MAG TPA: type II toxin-antitoxin system RelE/ParE family toxin [Rubrobacter sp.]